MVTVSRNLWVRAATALVLLPPVLGAVIAGGYYFQAFLGLAAFMMAREWHKITGHGGLLATSITFVLVQAGTLLLPYSFTGLAPDESLQLMFSVLVLLFSGFVLMCLVAWRTELAPFWWLAGSCYIALAVWGIMWLRLNEDGTTLVIWLFFTVWGADVGGYFAGKGIGGPKLAPMISPGKTWSGFLGGMALAAGVSALISVISGLWSPIPLAGLSAFLAVVAQIGDLFESALKRHFHLKDSGGLIPGHGGILDRVDGLAFASPMCAFLLVCFLLFAGS